MPLHRVQARWSGFPGAPGYSSFYFSPFTGGGDADAARERVRQFFNEFRSSLPNSVVVTIEPTVEVIDEETGMLTGYLDGDGEMEVPSGSSDATFAGPSGAVISWTTAVVNNGRRVRGRTFLVPLNADSYEADGTLTSSTIGDIRAGATLLTTNEFEQELVVWSRPRNGSGGVAAPVTGFRVPDMAAVLRSRRD